MDLGLKTASYKFPYLKMQLWDKDVLKFDDLIAEAQLDLGYYFKKAFRNACSGDAARMAAVVKVFEDPPVLTKDGVGAAAAGKALSNDPLFGDLTEELQDGLLAYMRNHVVGPSILDYIVDKLVNNTT